MLSKCFSFFFKGSKSKIKKNLFLLGVGGGSRRWLWGLELVILFTKFYNESKK